MPIYVYECSACADVYEVEQRIVEDALKDCRCGSLGTLKRVIQPVGIAFKGSGFYVNDSRASTSPTPEATPESPAESTTKPEDAPIPAEKPKSETPVTSVQTSE